MKISFIAFEPGKWASLEDQAMECFDWLTEYLAAGSGPLKRALSLNFFLSARNNQELQDQKSRLLKIVPPKIKETIPLAFLAQPPAGGTGISLEACILPEANGFSFEMKSMETAPYLVVINQKGEKLVVGNGLSSNHGPIITDDAEKIFNGMEKILEQEGLDFGHIFRQWNYIEDITRVEKDPESSQHYQQFNNVRAAWYGKSEFSHGYPAATGIGTNAGGVSVSFMACTKGMCQILPIENPKQKSAFMYTDQVLVGNAEYRGKNKCSPKFSRAQWLSSHDHCQVFISGTASIRDQLTVAAGDVEKQTEITLENIGNLISRETLHAPEQLDWGPLSVHYIRVYIKSPEDYSRVREVCEKNLPGIPALYVISDICREDLLVEIEALATV